MITNQDVGLLKRIMGGMSLNQPGRNVNQSEINPFILKLLRINLQNGHYSQKKTIIGHYLILRKSSSLAKYEVHEVHELKQN